MCRLHICAYFHSHFIILYFQPFVYKFTKFFLKFISIYFAYLYFSAVFIPECYDCTSYKICLYSATAQHAGNLCALCKTQIHEPSCHISCKLQPFHPAIFISFKFRKIFHRNASFHTPGYTPAYEMKPKSVNIVLLCESCRKKTFPAFAQGNIVHLCTKTAQQRTISLLITFYSNKVCLSALS